MFSKVDADQLRLQLGSHEFLSSDSEFSAAIAKHYANYKAFYGLDFEN